MFDYVLFYINCGYRDYQFNQLTKINYNIRYLNLRV